MPELIRIAAAYGVDLYDYERSGDGLLIAVGAGLMLATMDVIPRIRWCCDLSGGRGGRLADFLYWADRECNLFVVNAWFSISDPAPIAAAFAPFAAKTIWRANADGPAGAFAASDFRGLIQAASEFPLGVPRDTSPARAPLSKGSDGAE